MHRSTSTALREFRFVMALDTEGCSIETCAVRLLLQQSLPPSVQMMQRALCVGSCRSWAVGGQSMHRARLLFTYPGQDMPDSPARVTRLLQAIDRGESNAADELLPLVYEELRSRAGKLIAAERRDHTLQRTALVHEAYLRLAGGDLNFQSRFHFFNAAALAM